ncbi:hypothetical protein DVH24_029962 [Malus domestica]|uniref:PB1-like domain-containing protein n=1 Tax=Malus domestica TaxID=3750 RepID=A0A498I1E6_MALDO|nr:hypothetical protein DVH24_029962 [Malus domestica]
MEIHHGGHFIGACNGTMTCVGGHVAWFYNMNHDLMSRWDIEDSAKKLGYTKTANMPLEEIWAVKLHQIRDKNNLHPI